MFYNLILLIGAICQLPKWLIQKKYWGSRLQRLGFYIPPKRLSANSFHQKRNQSFSLESSSSTCTSSPELAPISRRSSKENFFDSSGKSNLQTVSKANKIPIIWIHMVSVGETKAMIPIYERLCQKYPNGAFFLSSTTKTGHLEAKRSLLGADGYFFLPLDFSWVMRKLVLRLKPDLLLLSEGDFWLNLINEVKNRGGKVVLLNGKISSRSASRFAKVPNFSKRLFGKIDYLCIQNTEYAARFQSLYVSPEKITVTGNLKLSISLKKISDVEKQKWLSHFNLNPTDRIITIGSTHEGEEEILLPHIKDAKVLLVPRHPERFSAVKKFLEKNAYPHVRLVDQMGILNICYQLSDLAIVGGSFLPGIGGHNIFEPIQAGIPAIFGPHMETQKELVQLILDAQAGLQTSHENLPEAIQKAPELTQNATQLALQGAEPAEATWEALQPYLLS